MAGRRAGKRRTGRRRSLSAAKEREVCDEFLAGRPHHELALLFGVSTATIARVLARHRISARHRGPQSPTPRPDFRADYAELGVPPRAAEGGAADPLAAASWLIEALQISVKHVVSDSEYEGNELQRRKEMREIARTIAMVTPQALLHRVKRLIEADADERDKPAGAELEDATQFTGRAHRAPPRRGRPRQH